MIREISFVLPAYNEADNISSVINNCLSVAVSITDRYEIIVVDDGSTDGTRGVVEALSNQFKNVRLITHDKNYGVAAATRTGFAAASYQYVFYTDSDGQFDIRDIQMLIPFAENFDFVVGYRNNRSDPIHRALNTLLYNWLIRLLFNTPIHDVNCAFKLMKRDALQRLNISSNSAFYLAELVIRATLCGMTFYEVPVRHYPRRFGKPTGSKFLIIFRELRDLVIFRFRKGKIE
jgi:glycosyltransferase involved in cell wall biosynthesis